MLIYATVLTRLGDIDDEKDYVEKAVTASSLSSMSPTNNAMSNEKKRVKTIEQLLEDKEVYFV